MPFTAIYLAILSLAVLYQNPKRLSRRAFCAFGITIATWFAMAQQAGRSLEEFRRGMPDSTAIWLRGNTIVAAIGLWLIALIFESIREADALLLPALRRSLPWLGATVAMIGLCFMPDYFRGPPPGRGPAYYAYSVVGFVALILLIATIRRTISSLPAGRRIEAQYLALVPALAYLFGIAANSVGNYFQLGLLKRFALVALTACFTLVAWVLSSKRIYDARYIFASAAQRGLVAFCVGLSVIIVLHLFLEHAPSYTAETAAVTALLILAGICLDHMLRRKLGLNSQDIFSALRAEILETGRDESRKGKLRDSFEDLLRRHCQASTAALMLEGQHPNYPTLIIDSRDPTFSALGGSGWVTPELLDGRHAPAGAHILRELLSTHSLGLLIATPQKGQKPSMIVALGCKRNGWPYTFPEIERIQQAGELMENILTHSRLSAQAALEARIEHLAMMSRGLAHDLKNLITPVSSFLVHAEGKITPDTVEAEVHAAAKRSVRIMNDYIREALVFANRLEPHFEEVSTGKLFDAVRELTNTRANWRKVKLVVGIESDHSLVGDAVLLQRLLGNLVSNAIDASPPGKSVILSAMEHAARGLRISVVDQGSGIPPEHLSRIFEPYFTTKEFGDEVRGFGLGLTISQKIVHLHHGNISVQSQVGIGTAITIDLPLKQPPAKPRMTEVSIADADAASLASPAR